MPNTRGRPRDPSRDRAILTAARRAIATDGYTGATMEAIAKGAGVGKDTLYRRWSSKEELALHIVDTMAREAVRPSPLDPDPRLDLLLFLKDIVRLFETTDFGQFVAGMVGAAARSPEFAQHFAAFWQRRRAVAASLVRDVVGTGASDEEIETHLDRLLGPVYYRMLVTHSEVTDEYLWDLIVALPWGDDRSDTDPNDPDVVTGVAN